MTSEVLYTVLILLVGLERVAELVVTKRNEAWSMSRGGQEFGAKHYPPMVVLHTALLAGALFEVWVRRPQISVGFAVAMLAVLVGSQGLRWWCITTLGYRWNTRVIIVPGLAPVTGGPYRFFSHPNYVAVVAEGIALPLIHGAWITALVFTVLNAWLLTVRIRCENKALAQLPVPSTVPAGT
ncbi:MAG: isoprenylcysteine carboxylmethyltransferase family protein [Allobranchiibius sp.]